MSDTQSPEPPASSSQQHCEPQQATSLESRQEEATVEAIQQATVDKTAPARHELQESDSSSQDSAAVEATGDLADNQCQDQQPSESSESSGDDEPARQEGQEALVEDTMRIDVQGDSTVATENPSVGEQQVADHEEEKVESVKSEATASSDDAQERQSHLAGVGDQAAGEGAGELQPQDQQHAEGVPDSHGAAQCDLAERQEQQVAEEQPRTWSGNSSLQDESAELEALDGEEDFCGESASNSTLRRLKISTFEDVLVCDQNRDSTDAARRLFDNLVRQQQQQQVERMPTGGRASAPPTHHVRRAGSLHSSEPEEDSEEHSPGGSSTGGGSEEQQLYDIKIVRRSGSSVSNSNSFRQTLVCSLSPTSQLGGSGSDLTSSPDAQYPIDGDEIKQCREAFRENKRLIEEQQERATKHLAQLARCQSSASCRSTGGSEWTNRFNRDYLEQQSKCSHCNLRLYPIDKMELDFTRTTLNIHRNCFKCQVCSTLLRLETYAALDAKLYCPAHIKCVTPSR